MTALYISGRAERWSSVQHQTFVRSNISQSQSKMSNSVTLLVLFLGILAFMADSTQQAPTFECGRSKFMPRIGEGSEADPGEFPWMAHIQMKDTYGRFCGGTLISDRHVLTAAHCFQNENESYLKPQIASITVGAHDINKDDGHHQKFGWKRIVTYANWNLENDVAIVTLSRPVNFTDYVQPACLPFEDDLDHVNDSVVLTGWGQQNSSGSFSSVLLKTETAVISSFGNDGQCQQTAGMGNFSGDKVICSDGSQGRRFLYGDDGGPMNFYNAECGRWFVIGVAGRVISGPAIHGPNVFTRVRAHLEFIRSHTGAASPSDCSSATNGTVPTAPTTPRPTTTTQKITTTSTDKTKTPITTSSTTNQPITFSCDGKANGNYPNPASSCSNTFYTCSNGNAYLFNCASGLVYREQIGVCDYPSNVAGC